MPECDTPKGKIRQNITNDAVYHAKISRHLFTDIVPESIRIISMEVLGVFTSSGVL